MAIIETHAYQTPDGKLFTDEKKAKSHYDDLIGIELDGLMRISKANITRTDEYKILTSWISQPKELKSIINKLHKLINFSDD